MSAGTRQGSPPSLLLNLFGDYWHDRTEPLPSTALVDLLADFSVTDVAARAALSRMVKNRLLTSSKIGRNTYYQITERTISVLAAGGRRIVEIGQDGHDWAGRWYVLAFVWPQQRHVRDALRGRLHWLGFAPLHDGTWVSPHDRVEQALAELHDFGVGDATALESRVVGSSSAPPQSAWDLAELADSYLAFIADTERIARRLEDGELSPVDALVRRTELVDTWVAFSSIDPDLPAALLPADWPQSRARSLFLHTHAKLGERASDRVREVVARYAPELAGFVAPNQFVDEDAVR